MTGVPVAAPAATPRGGGRRTRPSRIGFLLVTIGLPLVLYVGLVIWPFIQAIYYSLTDWGGFSNTMNFIGLDNYREIFSDDIFMKALRNNVILAIFVPLITVILSFLLATMLTVGGSSTGAVRGLKASSLYRIVSFFPYTIPAIVIGVIWSQIYDPSKGMLNGVLEHLPFGIGENFHSFAWLGDATTALPASVFVIIWGFVGFYMVLFVAAIKGIPSELYDAARIDGAGRVRTMLSVTLPMVRETVQTAYIYLGVVALDAFVYMAALNPTGGPDNSTLVMSQDLFKTAFTQNHFGRASAMGVVLAAVTLAFAGLVFAVNRLTGGKDVK
ncbi:sugar ABC transporter permease [Flexivirga endophytica]|uniref:Sugar ABC transporter permease n=1 Tax=Flexivirga endophytica TaxID=1849103 RepID=A0A916SW96_9MICO|nr:sugar ABC transporter permease [Flexivirga endophytica]GGB19797.1 sugar ABC transporter permease [Flexivirga endophytica]GHB35920.1 sugar ABC transporter permease [Flexivirga endophytica]